LFLEHFDVGLVIFKDLEEGLAIEVS
jgi:hypothetical protein